MMGFIAGFLSIIIGIASQPGDITPIDCPFDVAVIEPEVECGLLTVPVDHAQPDGPSMQIAYARVFSISPDPRPDPVIYLQGGPGLAGVEYIPDKLKLVGTLLAERDLIFYDPRGLGQSLPAVRCPNLSRQAMASLEGDSPLGGITDPESLVRQCRDDLVASGTDLTAYTTTRAAADLDLLRQTLGYDTWNIYGVSYGTRLGLTLARDYPEYIRSMVLDSPVPPHVNLIAESSYYSITAVWRLIEDCKADLICRTAYPNLEAVYREQVQTLNADPVEIDVRDLETDEVLFTVMLNGATFNQIVTLMMGHPTMRWAVPAFIFDVAGGNLEGISDFFSQLTTGIPAQDFGGALITACAEIAPYASGEVMQEVYDLAEEMSANVGVSAGMYRACEVWDVKEVDPSANDPVHSNIPTLILSGLNDMNAPPHLAIAAAETLTNNTLVVFPDAGHGLVDNAGECPLLLTRSFIHDPTAEVNTACVEDKPDRFVISYLPTRPLAWIVAGLGTIGAIFTLTTIGYALSQIVARRQIALQLKRLDSLRSTLIGSAVLIAALLFLSTTRWDIDPYRAVMIIVSIMMGVQTAIVIAAMEEPGLEMLLACPRPYHWLTLERLTVVFVAQLPIVIMAFIASALLAPLTDPSSLILGWLVPGIFLSGLAGYMTVSGRHPGIGVMIAILFGLAFAVGGNYLLPVQPPALPWKAPMDIIQPFLWIVHPYLRPDSINQLAYTLNRVIVAGIGLTLLGIMLNQLQNSEYLLLGRGKKKA